jgi:hypothetical protein
MGLEIRTAVDESAPVPRRTMLVLSCDLAEDMFCRGFEEFSDGDGGYIEHMAAAKRAGWVERQGRAGRLFVCARCA